MGGATALPGAVCHGGFGGPELEQETLWTRIQKATVSVHSGHSLYLDGRKQQKIYFSQLFVRKQTFALAGVAQWIECRPANHRVARSGHMPGLWARSPVGVM